MFAAQLPGTILVGVGNVLKDRTPIIGENLGSPAKAFGDLDQGCLPSQIRRLCSEGVAQIVLQGRSSLGGRRPDLGEVVGRYIPNQHV